MLLEVRAGFVLIPLEVAEANRSHLASLGGHLRAGEGERLGTIELLAIAMVYPGSARQRGSKFFCSGAPIEYPAGLAVKRVTCDAPPPP